MRILFLSILLTAGLFAQSNPKPAQAPATAPAAPEKKALSAEASARMAEIDATEANLQLKLTELAQLVQKGLQSQRNEVWVAACQSAGWLTQKSNECQVDQAARSITHVVPEAPKPEPKPEGK